MKIFPVRAFHDNIIWMITHESAGYAAAVDPGDDAPVEAFLRERGMKLAAIVITHHHHDHTGGIGGLLSRWKVPVYGPAGERVEGITARLADRQSFTVENMDCRIMAMETPGHTGGHLVYLLKGSGSAHCFTGDTLFSGGCGRIFEGTAADMYGSLVAISSLPDHTLIYPGHDYLAGNAKFIGLAEPDNRDFMEFMREAEKGSARGKLPLPTRLDFERKINPFLRCGVASVRAMAEKRAGRSLKSQGEVFRVLREWKNEV